VNHFDKVARPRSNEPGELERQHFELTRELFELKAQLRSRQGVSSGRVGHIRRQAQALEAKIELIELALGARQVANLASQKSQADPPRSKHFLAAFYAAARRQLPPELVARLEQAATSKERSL
jgi:ribosomal protein L29